MDTPFQFKMHLRILEKKSIALVEEYERLRAFPQGKDILNEWGRLRLEFEDVQKEMQKLYAMAKKKNITLHSKYIFHALENLSRAM